MTIQEFIAKYLGKQVEYHSYDPKAKYQCVDLVNQFIKEVLGLTPVIGTNAKDFPFKVNKDEFEVIKNTPDFIPQELDIAIWDEEIGEGAGHIAIVRDNNATKKTFNSVDQNWSKPLFVTLETHNYNNVSYFLRPKGQTMPEDKLGQCMEIRGQYWNDLMDIRKTLNLQSENLENDDPQIDQIKKSIAGIKGIVTQRNETIEELNKEIEQLKTSSTVPAVEGIKEPLRYVVSMVIGAGVTFAYSKFPFLGELNLEQATVITFLTGLVIRGISEFKYYLDKRANKEQPGFGLLRFDFLSQPSK